MEPFNIFLFQLFQYSLKQDPIYFSCSGEFYQETTMPTSTTEYAFRNDSDFIMEFNIWSRFRKKMFSILNWNTQLA